jgi:histone deacetylase 1/2
MYVAQVTSDGKFFIVVYVNDVISVFNNKDKLVQVKKKLSRKFEMKDFGDLHFFLGMEVEKDYEQHFYINQIRYLKEIFKHFCMEGYKAMRVTFDPKMKLKKNMNKDVKMVGVPYQEVIGSLMYVVLCIFDQTWHTQ